VLDEAFGAELGDGGGRKIERVEWNPAGSYTFHATSMAQGVGHWRPTPKKILRNIQRRDPGCGGTGGAQEPGIGGESVLLSPSPSEPVANISDPSASIKKSVGAILPFCRRSGRVRRWRYRLLLP